MHGSRITFLTYSIEVQVAIRVRPPLLRELEGYQPFQNTALVDTSQRILTVSENLHAIQNGEQCSRCWAGKGSMMTPVLSRSTDAKDAGPRAS